VADFVTIAGDLVSPVAGPLLRRGAPVCGVVCAPDGVDVIVEDGIVIGLSGPVVNVAAGFYTPTLGEAARLHLLLSDDLGADIAARWLARHHGLTVGLTAPFWLLRGDPRRRTWSLGCWEADCTWQFTDDIEFAKMLPFRVAYVPRIASLTDPREALRLACLAAVGRTPEIP